MCHFSVTFSRSSALNLVNAHFLEMWIQDVVTGELELGPNEGLNHRLFVLHLSGDGHYDSADVDPGQCTPGLSRGPTHTWVEPRLGRACQSWQSTGKSCIQGRSRQPAKAAGCTHCLGGCCSQPLLTGPPRGKSPVSLTGCSGMCACIVAQPCLTRCDPVDSSPPDSSVHGILQARILERVAISSSRGSFWPRDRTHVSCVS